ncbi:MAG: transcription termination factor Rho [Clostridia bacterium]
MRFNREQLEDMSVWQLRDYARKLGHTSPASRKKGELVDYILNRYDEIDKGGVLPHQEPARRPRGRPPKAVISDYTVPVPIPKQKVADKPLMEEYGESARVKPQENGAVRDFGKIQRERTIPRGDGRENGTNGQRENINPDSADVEIREGVLEICPDGYGFLRAKNYEQGEGDAYIAAPKIRKSGLRKGDYVVAYVKKLAENRPWNVLDIKSVNGLPPQKAFNRPQFDTLTPIYPDERLKLEIGIAKNDFAIRAIDLVAPIGKGQRAMIVSPPKAGKTTLLKKIAHSISTNYPEAHLIVLLIDERPEEVTDMQRSIKGEVVYSTFDEMPEHHTKAAEMVLERAKRLTEMGKDVVILMDSLTRLARAYNLVITPTGKTLSGGIDPGALHNPKRFFGAARNIEFGGSLTIIATALVDTGSRMDDVIYEEFKGTGNMEIHLDRKLSEKRIFPAIDLNRSGTRREELLLDQKELEGIWAVRKMLSSGDVQEATENLIAMMVKTANNREFIEQLSLQILKLQKEGYVMR